MSIRRRIGLLALLTLIALPLFFFSPQKIAATVFQTVNINSMPALTVATTLPVNVQNTPGVNVQNTPGVNVQNTPGVVCISGCVAAPGPTDGTGIPYVHPTALPTLNANIVNFPAASPTDASGFPYVHPTALPTMNVHSVDATPVPAQTSSSGAATVSVSASDDPCANVAGYATAPFSAVATDTTVITHSGSTKTYICSAYLTNGVATGNTRIRYGTTTTTACDTGGVNLYNSGLMLSALNANGGGYPVFKAVPASQDVCITFTGTGGTGAGSLTYVQQ
jgi:hypothetical protein